MIKKIENKKVNVVAKLLLLMFFITSIVVIKDNVKASSIEDFKYRETSWPSIGIAITGYTGTDANVDIPNSIDGKNVVQIDYYAFRGNTSIVNVTVPENVTTIGQYAFSECANLVKVDIYSSNLSVNDYGFFKCEKLEEFNCYNGIPKIGKNVFTNTKMAYGEEVKDSFRDTSIKTAVINPGTVEISSNVFYGCDNLKTVYINSPQLINFGSNGSFYGCNNLEKVIITDENQYYKVIDDIIYTKDMKRLVRCLPGKRGKVNIPDSVTTIDSYAFNSCKYLEDILVIPNSVTTIEAHAFEGCMSEIPLVLSNNLTRIEQWAFQNSKFNGNLVIPDSVTEICANAFYNCSNFIGELKLSRNCVYIRDHAFYNCSGLTGGLTFYEQTQVIGDAAFALCESLNGKVEFLYNGDRMLYLGQYAFAQDINIKEIKTDAEANCSEGVFLNCKSLESVDHIQWPYTNTFAGCTNITNLKIGGLNGNDILRGLKNLEELEISSSATSLGRATLAECTKLKTLRIPSTVTSIATNAFYKTENIQDIYVDNTRDNVNYAQLLESICPNVHYNDSKYTISKSHNDNIEIVDIESDYEDGYKLGSTYKFKIEPKAGYTINNLKVVLKVDGTERELTRENTDEQNVYIVEDIKQNMEIVITCDVTKEKVNSESIS